MGASRSLALAIWLFWGMHAVVYAQTNSAESRGKLLYSTHCNACHASEVHWREHDLVADWKSLKSQVRRWQASIGLGWGEEEITDVTRYLNAVYYDFLDTDQEDLSQGKEPRQILREY